MPRIEITRPNGETIAIDRDENVTLMEAIRDAGIDELLALCGGCCSCATCHVHIDDGFLDALVPMTEDENELLESSEHRTNTSRLSCQIRLSRELDGMKVQVVAD